MKFESDAFITTLIHLDNISADDGVEVKWKDLGTGLNLKLQGMGLHRDQSVAVVQCFFEKVSTAFEGSGLYFDPVEACITQLYEYIHDDEDWGSI